MANASVVLDLVLSLSQGEIAKIEGMLKKLQGGAGGGAGTIPLAGFDPKSIKLTEQQAQQLAAKMVLAEQQAQQKMTLIAAKGAADRARIAQKGLAEIEVLNARSFQNHQKQDQAFKQKLIADNQKVIDAKRKAEADAQRKSEADAQRLAQRQAAAQITAQEQAAARVAAAQQRAQQRAQQQAQPRQQRQPTTGQIIEPAVRSYQVSQGVQYLGGLASQLGAPRIGGAIANVGEAIQALGPKFGIASAAAAGFAGVAVAALTQIAIAGIRSGAELESAYSKLTALTNLKGGDLPGISGLINSIASGPTQASTQQLTESIYTVASSGFQGDQAKEILRQSAKANLAGLGELGDSTKVIVKVLSTYGEQNISAARTVDILTQAIREGAAEPDDFAKQIGKLLPFAQELGVEFDETASGLAAVSLITRDASVAATQLQNAYGKLLSPTGEGTKVLDQLFGEGKGISEIQRIVRDEGFLQAIERIYKGVGGDKQALGDVFGDIRGLSAVLTLAIDDFDRFEGILGRVRNSFGETDKAAAEFSDDLNVKVQTLTNVWDSFTRQIAAPLMSPLKFLIDDATAFLLLMQSGAWNNLFGEWMTRVFGGRYDAPTLAGAVSPGLTGTRSDLGSNPIRQMPKGQALSPGLTGTVGEFSYSTDLTNEQIMQMGGRAGLESRRAVLEARGFNVDKAIAQLENAERSKAGASYSQMRSAEASRYASSQVAQPPVAVRDQMGGYIVPSSMNDTLSDVRRMAAEGVKVQEQIAEARIKVNETVAANAEKGVEQAIQRAGKYDSTLGKLDDIEEKLARTPRSVATGGLTRAEKKRLDNLRFQQSLAGLQNKIRENNIVKAEIGLSQAKKAAAVQRATLTVENSNLTDQIGDARADRRVGQISELEQKQRTAGTATNPKYRELEQQAEQIRQDFKQEGFGIVENEFFKLLKNSAGDQQTFNRLLDSGGDILQLFAEDAGLFKSSGFTLELAQAGLEAKYLRDEMGRLLTGDAAVEGFGNYAAAFAEFRERFLDLRKLMEQTEPISVKQLIDFELVDARTADIATNKKTQGKIKSDAEALFKKTGDQRVLDRGYNTILNAQSQVAELRTPGAIQKQLLEEFGLSQETTIKQLFKIESVFGKGDAAKLEAEADQLTQELGKIRESIKAELEKFKGLTIGDIFSNFRFEETLPDLKSLFGGDLGGLNGLGQQLGPAKPTGPGLPIQIAIEPIVDTKGANKVINQGIQDMVDEYKTQKFEPAPEFPVSAENTDVDGAKAEIQKAIEKGVADVSGKTYTVLVNVAYQINGAPPNIPGVAGVTSVGVSNSGTATGSGSGAAGRVTPAPAPGNNRRTPGGFDPESENADGTTQLPKGVSLVGERGPELIYNRAPNIGVLTAAQTRDYIGGRSPDREEAAASVAATLYSTPSVTGSVPAGLDASDRGRGAEQIAAANYRGTPGNPNSNGVLDAFDRQQQRAASDALFDRVAAMPSRSFLGSVAMGGVYGAMRSVESANSRIAQVASRQDFAQEMFTMATGRFMELFRMSTRVAPTYNNNNVFNVDARQATQPVRVREQVNAAVSAAMDRLSAADPRAAQRRVGRR